MRKMTDGVVGMKAIEKGATCFAKIIAKALDREVPVVQLQQGFSQLQQSHLKIKQYDGVCQKCASWR